MHRNIYFTPEKQSFRGFTVISWWSVGWSVADFITQNVQELSTLNFVGRYILLSRIAVQKNQHSAYPSFVLIALCLFYTLNIVRDIILKP
jgi:hypothetical protein